MKAIITVVGRDEIGIIAKAAGVCAERQVNIEDISQTIMQNCFTMTMLVDLRKMTGDFKSLKEDLTARLSGMQVHVMSEDIFQSMHRV